jgi:hypothetical protein
MESARGQQLAALGQDVAHALQNFLSFTRLGSAPTLSEFGKRNC